MSRPDGWEVSVADLFNHAKDGEDAIRSGLAELREVGHMRYVRQRDRGRITGMLIEVYEVPGNLPHADFPDVEKPDVENPTQVLSTASSTKDIGANPAPVLTIENQIYANASKVVMPSLDDWSAKRDIAAMQIIRMGADLEPLAVAAMDALKIIPAKREVKGWALALREMRTAGVSASIITQAAQKLRDSGMTVADPFGLKKTAIVLAAKPLQPAAQGMTYEY
jgi:hypothetical protein